MSKQRERIIPTVHAAYRPGTRVRHERRKAVGTIERIEWTWHEDSDTPGIATYVIRFDPKPDGRYGHRAWASEREIWPVESEAL